MTHTTNTADREPRSYTRRAGTVLAMRFTNESKDRVYNWITCTRVAEREAGVPVLDIATRSGIQRARFGDYVVKRGEGDFYVVEAEAFVQLYEEA